MSSARTFQPVRRSSRPHELGEAFFRKLDPSEVQRIMQAARAWARQPRKKGRRWGPLGPVDLEVLEAMLFKFMTWKTGKLDPSYDQLAAKIRRSKQTVTESLKRLKAEGFLTWIRRFERIDAQPGEAGPQVRQCTNAYQVGAPAKALRALGGRAAARPKPDDFEAERAERAAYYRACAKDAEEQSSPSIAKAAAKARAEQERESTNRPDSPDQIVK